MTAHLIPDQELSERPPGYRGPNLSPRGLELRPQRLAEGAHALLATAPPKDNNGLIAGSKAALVIDAGITPGISRQIQALAAELTDQPVRYLANTTYHGDHTFGNAAFPDEVIIVSARPNKANMSDLAYEKRIRSGNMYGDEAMLDEVTTWRKPDVTFESFTEIDLGGQVAQLWHFGPGNGPGDTIVYSPEARTAWTGNFLSHAGIGTMLLQGGPLPYIASLEAMRRKLPELETIVPGHGPMGDAQAALSDLTAYLTRLHEEVSASVEDGRTLEETEAAATNPWAGGLDPVLAGKVEKLSPVPPEEAKARMLSLLRNMHRLNVLATYRLYQPMAR